MNKSIKAFALLLTTLFFLLGCGGTQSSSYILKNETQVETWFRWYKNGETHRFHQQVGKQYSYEKGMAELSEIDQLKLELKRKEVELEILKKYKELERKCRLK